MRLKKRTNKFQKQPITRVIKGVDKKIELQETQEEYPIVECEIHPAKIICPDCGGITLEGLDFCDKCGGEINIIDVE